MILQPTNYNQKLVLVNINTHHYHSNIVARFYLIDMVKYGIVIEIRSLNHIMYQEKRKEHNSTRITWDNNELPCT